MTQAITLDHDSQAASVAPDATGHVFQRQVPVQLAEGDGRTLEARIVPYNVVATVADGPLMPAYREMFLPGAFAPQLSAANRVDVLLNYEHRQSITDVVGRGTNLEDRGDGLYGAFRVLDHQDGDKALELVNAGVLRGMSIEFLAKRSKTVDGVVQRVDARVRNVALCRTPAYEEAQVLAVREAPEQPPVLIVPVVAPLDRDRLARVGIMPVFERAIVRTAWDGSPSRYTDEEYQAACLIDRGGDVPVKERCSLPVLEPNGDLNVNALGPAAAALRGARGGLAGVTQDQKTAAARKLVRFYRMAEVEPPAGIRMMAG